MKVYRLRLIMGKTPNYDENGKLKNKVIKAKYSGEMELTNILDDDNYKKLGACEISCIGVYDTVTKEQDESRMGRVNIDIYNKVKANHKPKSKVQLLEEQNELLRKQLKGKPDDGKQKKEDEKLLKAEQDRIAKEDDKELEDARAKYLELYKRKPNHLMKLETMLKKIEEKS